MLTMKLWIFWWIYYILLTFVIFISFQDNTIDFQQKAFLKCTYTMENFFIQQPVGRRWGIDMPANVRCHKIREAERKGLTTFYVAVWEKGRERERERERERRKEKAASCRPLLTPNQRSTRSCTPDALYAMQPSAEGGGGTGGSIARARFFMSPA